jgi:hypothetical protein
VRFGEGRPPLKARWVRNAHSSLPRAPVRVDLTQDAVIPEGAWVEYTDREQWLKSALEREAPTVDFTDMNGLRWRLDRYGELTRLGSVDDDGS